MPNDAPLGCLAALFGWRAAPEGAPVDDAPTDGPLPYRLRDDFLSPAEQSFYRVLRTVVADRGIVCPKVNLADLFFVPGRDGQSHRNRIDRKHVDFVVCDPATLRPVAGIELDDSSHARADRQQRDAFVERVFAAAGLPLVRMPVRSAYAPAELAERLAPWLNGAPTPAPEAGPVPSTHPMDAAPTCPKCGIPMVRRTASRGENAGQAFYGCANYPRCRETTPAV